MHENCTKKEMNKKKEGIDWRHQIYPIGRYICRRGRNLDPFQKDWMRHFDVEPEKKKRFNAIEKTERKERIAFLAVL